MGNTFTEQTEIGLIIGQDHTVWAVHSCNSWFLWTYKINCTFKRGYQKVLSLTQFPLDRTISPATVG